MSHRVFRLSISPDDDAEVRRVIDFDGRNTLADVHWMMHRSLNIHDGDDHLYAFFLSGDYWDNSSEYVDPRTEGPRADQALLFRLRLRAGQRFVYVYDFGTEHRFALTVVSVTEALAPLPAPVLVESVGDAPSAFHEADEDDEAEMDPAWQEQFELANTVADDADAFADLADDIAPEEARSSLRKLGEAALRLLRGIDGNFRLLSAIDRQFELTDYLLELPAQLSTGGETDLAVGIAEALKFCAPDNMNGEIALAYARSGDRERALAQVLTSLELAKEPFIAEYKAGDVYRELGEADAAEAYYRRALALAETTSDYSEAMLRITSLLIDSGREAEATAFVAQQRAAADSAASAPPQGTAAQLPSVGRNDPCPCASGKKYKKCHGA